MQPAVGSRYAPPEEPPATAPAEDHILLFTTTGEIRDFLNKSGWDIVEEQIDTINDMPLDEAEEGGHNINYAAILQPQN